MGHTSCGGCDKRRVISPDQLFSVYELLVRHSKEIHKP